jgi:hypothetical protein
VGFSVALTLTVVPVSRAGVVKVDRLSEVAGGGYLVITRDGLNWTK